MKKSFLFSLSIAAMFSLFVFAGCGQTMLSFLENNISEVRHNLFEGQTQDYFITFTSGQRENPYIVDGKKGNIANFGIILVLPKFTLTTSALDYVITVNNKEYSGQLEQSPFDSTLAGDIGVVVSEADSIHVQVNRGSNRQEADLTCISCEFDIKSDTALSIAAQALGTELITMTDNGKIPLEVYIRIVSDADKIINTHYWFVSFVSSEGNHEMSVVIDPDSGEVRAKKI